MKQHQYRTPLSNARGLGSAKEGVNHWVWQRLTALALIPLTIWFMVSLLGFTQDVARFGLRGWMGNPINALLSVLLFSAMLYHAKLGLQVVIEDYLHCPVKKTVALILVKLTFVLAALASLMAIAKLHF